MKRNLSELKAKKKPSQNGFRILKPPSLTSEERTALENNWKMVTLEPSFTSAGSLNVKTQAKNSHPNLKSFALIAVVLQMMRMMNAVRSKTVLRQSIIEMVIQSPV